MTDFIPRSDAEFQSWEANFVNYLTAHLSELGLTPDDLTMVTNKQGQWQNTYSDHIAKQAAAESARQDKLHSRKDYESLLRSLTKQLQANPKVTDGHKAALKIRVPQTVRTQTTVPTTRPMGWVDANNRLQHLIRFVDEQTPNRRAKPSGVMGCEVWVKVGGSPPTGPNELKFLGMDTATPYLVSYEEEHAGQIAYYMLRWENKRGEPGPWSQTFSAVIQG